MEGRERSKLLIFLFELLGWKENSCGILYSIELECVSVTSAFVTWIL